MLFQLNPFQFAGLSRFSSSSSSLRALPLLGGAARRCWPKGVAPVACAALLAAAMPHAGAQQLGTGGGSPALTVAPPAEFITVAPGDTAYSLAKRHGLEVPELLALNQLSSHDLAVGQVLRVLASPPYQVVKGDTAYSIAKAHGTRVADLLAVNGLGAGAHIEVGQWLTIPRADLSSAAPTLAFSPPAVQAARPSQGKQHSESNQQSSGDTSSTGGLSTGGLGQAAPAHVLADDSVKSVAPAPLHSVLPQSRDWRANALALLDTPYVYGGNSESGIDCSAFVLRVFQPLGVSLPRTSAAQARTGFEITREELSAGDLVFFDTVDSGKVTHVGIYLGNHEFVNANSYLGKVAIDNLESAYWAPRFLGARRVLGAGVQAQGGSNYD